jgi:SsrA-binding protein
MAATKKKPPGKKEKVVALNRKARFEYVIEERFEAGMELQGTEVKSLRAASGNIAESYAEVKGGELWLVNCHIAEFSHGNLNNHQPKRPRKLLMHRREINRLGAAVKKKGMTIVPLALYFNPRGRIKIELGLAKGKQAHDKRQTIKDRDWKREQGRLLRGKA